MAAPRNRPSGIANFIDWRWILLLGVTAVLLIAALTQVQIAVAPTCPASGPGFCTVGRYEPLLRSIIDQLRAVA